MWGIMEEVLRTGGRGAGNVRAPSRGAATQERGSPPGVQENGLFIVSFTVLNFFEIHVL